MKVYAKGLNFMGQLAQGNYENLQQFASIPYLEGIKVKQLKTHLTQSYALLEDNQIIHWGWVMDNITSNRVLSFYKKSPTLLKWWQKYSIFGDTLGMRLGSFSPVLLNKKMLDYQTKSLSVGGCFILALMNDGTVFGMGENYKGQLGMGDQKYRFQLEKLPIPSKEKIVDISSGYQHSVLISESGRAYGCGRANHFQVINSKNQEDIYVDSYFQMQPIYLANDEILKVSCGFNHTLLLSSKQRIYSMGLNLYGQCGVSNFEDTIVKQLSEVFIDLEPGETITQMASGQAHNLILTSTGRLLFFGNIEHNQLGTQNLFDFEQTGLKELQLPLEKGEKIVKIYANFDRSAVVTSTGDAIIWGGQDFSYFDIPHYEKYSRLRGELGIDCQIKDIGLGFGHILVYVEQ